MNGNVTICKYKKAGVSDSGKTGAKEMSKMFSTTPSQSIYPGALVRVDQELVQGKPKAHRSKTQKKAFHYVD